MNTTIRTLTLLSITWLIVALLAGCDASESSPAGDTSVSGDTSASDDISSTDTTFACGAQTTCATSTQACAGRGQGACVGPAPAADGTCAPDCHVDSCGGQATCLCDTFWCVDLPTGCASCACATLPDASCTCDDSSGTLVLSCAGA